MPTEKSKDKQGEFYQWGLGDSRTKKYYLNDYEKQCKEYWENRSDVGKCEDFIAKFLANKQGQAVKISQNNKGGKQNAHCQFF